MDDRLAEPVTEPVERFRGGGQGLVQLDRVDLLSHIHHRLEQRVELGGHRRHVDHIFCCDALRGWVFRRRERDVLVAEHRGGGDIGDDVLRDVLEVLGIHVQDDLRPWLIADGDRLDLADPADLHAVVGDLRARVHRQTRARRDHGQLSRDPGSRRGTARTPARTTAMVSSVKTNPANLYGGSRLVFSGAVIRYTVRLKFGSTP